jgi:hypothetical protein
VSSIFTARTGPLTPGKFVNTFRSTSFVVTFLTRLDGEAQELRTIKIDIAAKIFFTECHPQMNIALATGRVQQVGRS